jgi:hypothetical protein
MGKWLQCTFLTLAASNCSSTSVTTALTGVSFSMVDQSWDTAYLHFTAIEGLIPLDPLLPCTAPSITSKTCLSGWQQELVDKPGRFSCHAEPEDISPSSDP